MREWGGVVIGFNGGGRKLNVGVVGEGRRRCRGKEQWGRDVDVPYTHHTSS